MVSNVVEFGMKYRRDRHLRTVLDRNTADKYPLDLDGPMPLVISLITSLRLQLVLQGLHDDMALRGRFHGEHPVTSDPNGLHTMRTILDAEQEVIALLSSLIRRRPPPCPEPLNSA